MKNNIGTIMKKEFARFFGDRMLVFTALIMPGLLIYCIYSFMGQSIADEMKQKEQQTEVYVNNAPETMRGLFDSMEVVCHYDSLDLTTVKEQIGDEEQSVVYVAFPEGFDSLIQLYPYEAGVGKPNISIVYNSSNDASYDAYKKISDELNWWQQDKYYHFSINAGDDSYDVSTETIDESLGDILGKFVPVLLLMLLFSGCMALAPTAIAGEKERGTIATLLVTPMRRNQLAIGKIGSLSVLALLSGLSSFLGIILSLPKLIPEGAEDVGREIGSTMTTMYAPGDYALLLIIILCTTLLLVTLISIISAFAKNVKAASTMVSPLMLVVMLVGLAPMMGDGTPTDIGPYCIPLLGNVYAMIGVFSFKSTVATLTACIVSNLIYTGIGVWILTKLFNSERVMFGK